MPTIGFIQLEIPVRFSGDVNVYLSVFLVDDPDVRGKKNARSRNIPNVP